MNRIKNDLQHLYLETLSNMLTSFSSKMSWFWINVVVSVLLQLPWTTASFRISNKKGRAGGDQLLQRIKRLNLNIIGIWFHWRKVYLIIKIIMHIKVFVVCISINCCKRTDRRLSISWGYGSVVVQFIFKIIMHIAWFCCVQHQEVTNIFG